MRVPIVQKRNDSIGKGQDGSIGLVLVESGDVDDTREIRGSIGRVVDIRWDSRVDVKEEKGVWLVWFILWSVYV